MDEIMKQLDLSKGNEDVEIPAEDYTQSTGAMGSNFRLCNILNILSA